MEQLKVSVILPQEKEPVTPCLGSLLNQTCRDFEVLYVGTAPEAAERAAKDSRVRVFAEEFSDPGAAAAYALEQARGSYVLILRGSDVCARDLLERSFNRAEETRADITAFCGHTHSRVGNEGKDNADGFRRGLLQNGCTALSREDYPDWSVLNPELSLWLLNREFLQKKGIRFAEGKKAWRREFCALCAPKADTIALLDWRLMTCQPETGFPEVREVLAAFDRLTEALGTGQAALGMLVEYATAAFCRAAADFGAADARLLYTGLQSRFASSLFAGLDTGRLPGRERALFETIRNTPYETMLQRATVPLVVSFTSFPKRIGYTVNVIENVRRQTRTADKVLLYLAPEQFLGKEADLPQALLDQAKRGDVQIKWVPDVRSHKKYHYVMQEYADCCVVTLDDDLAYPDDMLEKLFLCYLCNPDQVSAMRAHLTVVDAAAGALLTYDRWVKEYRGATYVPSPQLFVTSGAGTLFPPRVLHPLALDIDKAWSLCPYADDVWLNHMILLNGRSVVLAVDDFTMKNMPGSQEEALQTINVDQNQNDVQYEKIRSWLKAEFGRDVIWEALTAGDPGVRCRTVTELSDQYLVLDDTRKQVQEKLHRTWADKLSREQEVEKLRAEIRRLNGELTVERNKFLPLRKFCKRVQLLKTKGIGYTVKLGVKKVLRKVTGK